MQKKWLIVALGNFLVVGLLGILMRFIFLEEFPWVKYMHILHAHSHVAMLGWVYMALYALLVNSFLGKNPENTRSYHRLFWATEVSVIGMLVSFILQGYGAISIFFSASHVVLSYIFIYKFLRDTKHQQTNSVKSIKVMRIAMYFMVFSTLGVWALGPLSNFWGEEVALIHIAVQFFLHFQFNGWFLFAVLGLFYKSLEDRQIVLDADWEKRFFILLIISTFLTFALAVAWSNPYTSVFVINSIGVLVQLIAAICFIRMILPIRQQLMDQFQGVSKILMALVLLCFLGKILVQSAVTFPFVAIIAYTIRNYVIGFIHLMLLGMFTFFILGYIQHKKIMDWNKLTGIGIALLITGFVGKELLLFIQGTMFWAAMGFMPFYYEFLFGISVFLPLGIAIILVSWRKIFREEQKNTDLFFEK